MEKVRNFFAGIAGFTREVIVELKKSEWPGRQELVSSTIVVIVTVMLLGVFIGFSDMILVNVLKWLI